MHNKSASSTKAPNTQRKMASTKVPVYTNSRKGAAVANGNGHAKPLTQSEETRTVILSEQQVELMNNNVVPATGLVTIPVAPKDKVFECPEESLFYCQCIEGMVLNRCVGSCNNLLHCLLLLLCFNGIDPAVADFLA